MKNSRTRPMIPVERVALFEPGCNVRTGAGSAPMTRAAWLGVSRAVPKAARTPRYLATPWTRAGSAGELAALVGSSSKRSFASTTAKSAFPERRAAFAAPTSGS